MDPAPPLAWPFTVMAHTKMEKDISNGKSCV